MAAQVSKTLEAQITKLVSDVMSGRTEPGDKLEAQLKVIDRALKLEALKLKAEDADEGSEFDD